MAGTHVQSELIESPDATSLRIEGPDLLSRSAVDVYF
jgi:hypothetical protein